MGLGDWMGLTCKRFNPPQSLPIPLILEQNEEGLNVQPQLFVRTKQITTNSTIDNYQSVVFIFYYTVVICLINCDSLSFDHVS
jgi:hypothetical protein